MYLRMPFGEYVFKVAIAKTMASTSRYYCILLLFCVVELSYCLMTQKQVEATQKLVRRTCKSKAKITSDVELDGMRAGSWDNLSRAAKCYLQCCLSMLKVVDKDGYIDLDAGMKQSVVLPPKMKAASEKAITTCVDKGREFTDKCEISYHICHCFYQTTPDDYLIP